MRGGRVVLQDITKPTTMEWGTPLEVLVTVLDLHKKMTDSLLELQAKAMAKVDFHLVTFVQEKFLNYNVNFVKIIGDLVTMTKRAGDGLGIHMIDTDIAKFKQPPGVMEHFETATRDPSFFRLHKYMNNIFKEFKVRLPPYTYEELNFEGVSIESVNIEGSLETYFEDFEFSLINAVDDTAEIADVAISAIVKRLNHKPFSFVMNINNANGAEVTASARLYLCPRRDNNDVPFHPNIGRWGCIEMDKFWVKLAPGANTVVRKSSESAVTVPDSPSFQEMIDKTDASAAAGGEYTWIGGPLPYLRYSRQVTPSQ